MYVNRLDAILAWLPLAFPGMEITADLKELDSQSAPQLKKGIATVIPGPAHSFDKTLFGQAPLGRQIISLVIQKKLSTSATGADLTRAELALMDDIRKLQNDTNLPPEAAGLIVRDIVPSQQSKLPDLEIIATFEVID